jgi:aspartate aminotransferase
MAAPALPPLNALAGSAGMSPTMAGSAAPCAHPDPVDLSVGEPFGLPPQAVREAAAAAALEGRSRYGPVAGLPRLRALVAADLTRRDGVPRGPEQVLITAGGKPAILDALRCILEPGDEVAIFAPYWPSFKDQVRWAGGVPVIVAPGPDLLPSLEALDRAVGPRTRAVIVNQPSNPTGRVWDAPRLARLSELVLKHQAWVILDQVYGTLTLDGPEEPLLRLAPELAGCCLAVESFSKRFAMTGYRLGAAAGPLPLIQAMTALGSTSVTHACTLSQHAGMAALELDGTWEAAMLDQLRRRRDRLADGLRNLPGLQVQVPQGGLYLFPEVTGWLAAHGVADDTALVARLRDEAGVKVLPGSAFGVPGFLRLCFASDGARLEVAVQRLQAFFLAP